MRARKAQTRQQLVDAGLRLFEAHGFTQTTLEQIAEEAGVTKGAVYSNFANKEALFVETLRNINIDTDLSMFGDRAASLADRFARFGAVNAAAFTPSIAKTATKLEAQAFALRNPRSRDAYAEMLHRLMHDVETALEHAAPDIGATPVVASDVVTIITQALLDGLEVQRAFLPDVVTPEVVATATRLLAQLFDENVPSVARVNPPDH